MTIFGLLNFDEFDNKVCELDNNQSTLYIKFFI